MPPIQQIPILNKDHHNKPLFFFALFISIAILVFAIWYGYDMQAQQARDVETTRLIAQTTLNTTDETANWKTYRNEEYGFEFKYPDLFKVVSESKDKDTTMGSFVSLSRVDDEDNKYFEIFSVDSTDKHDLIDEHSLIGTINLGGVVANKFFVKEGICEEPGFCTSPFIGVKVIKNNIRYELLFFNQNDLTDEQIEILSTFKFIHSTSSTSSPQRSSGQVSTSTNVSVKSGVRGKVIIGPTCPVMREPPDTRCDDKPYQAEILVTDTSENHKNIIIFKSNVDGTFIIDLPPGNYILWNAAGYQLPAFGPQEVTVKTNTYTEVSIQFDSGIR